MFCRMVPNLSPLNLASVELGKNFMLSHGYIKKDFDMKKWVAPEFLEQAARELLEEQWKKTTSAKLPDTTKLFGESKRIGQPEGGPAGSDLFSRGAP
jgi:hypothetical protein